MICSYFSQLAEVHYNHMCTDVFQHVRMYTDFAVITPEALLCYSHSMENQMEHN